ncbi:hypothetical protein GCM10017668_48030 [Streptomyces tuirus]|uniref:Uncharacterized protein n=1 Tax=Streptomyces tuirus TaxID=68278 RepID=A0A7G1NMP1_9ACTN|nr:hypothetical protein GCM10017668_48030 [Streptomyces tuirus]
MPGRIPASGVRPGRLRALILGGMYFTDRGIEELEKRRGEEEVTFEWLAEQLRTFVDLNPDFEVPVERLATWLARLDDEDDE